MEKVTIKITGYQRMGEERDETVVCAEGTYEKRNEMYQISYEEKTEDGEIIQNVISASARGIKISKKGAVVSDMLFIPGQSKAIAYQTPFGTLSMENSCKQISIKEEPDKIAIDLEYDLYTNGEPVAECMTQIRLQKETV